MKMEARVCEDTGFFLKGQVNRFSPSARTASPLGSDCESEAFGQTATIKTQGCFIITLGYFSISVPYFSISVPYFSISVP